MAAPIPHGPWRLLLYYWTYGPHWKAEDPLPAHGEVEAWPKRKTCATDLGVKYDTVKTWHRWLAEHGWIKRTETGIALAVERPCEAWLDQRRGDANPCRGEPALAGGPKSGSDAPGSTQTRVQPNPGLTKPDPGSTQTRPPGLHKPAPGFDQTRPSKPPKNLPIEPAKEPPPATQASLALVSPEPDDFESILAEHQAARQRAQHAHGKARTALPGPRSAKGKALRDRLRVALARHGPDRCREHLAFHARRWLEDVGVLRWSTDSVWSTKTLGWTLEARQPGGLARVPDWTPPTNRPTGEPVHRPASPELLRAIDGETGTDYV